MTGTRWSQYAACDQCEAPPGRPCLSLLRKDRAPRVRPHYGRPRILQTYRAPGQSSRLAEIVIGVMTDQGKRPADLVPLLNWHKNTTYRVIGETKHPMTLLEADQILAVLGYRLQHRAVPINPVGEE